MLSCFSCVQLCVIPWLQSCSTPCDLPGSSVHGILQARTLEWVAMPFSRESSQPRDWTCNLTSPTLAGRFFTTSTTELGYPDKYICLELYTSTYCKLGEEYASWLWYSCQENLTDRGAWWATVHGATKSQTCLSTHTHNTSLGRWGQEHCCYFVNEGEKT